jgi:hypothetical protein
VEFELGAAQHAIPQYPFDFSQVELVYYTSDIKFDLETGMLTGSVT